MYWPFLYGGQGREPQTAVTGNRIWPSWLCCRAPSVKYSASSWRQTKSKACQSLSSLSVTKNPWYCMFQPLGHVFFAGIIIIEPEPCTWHTAHGTSSSWANFRYVNWYSLPYRWAADCKLVGKSRGASSGSCGRQRVLTPPPTSLNGFPPVIPGKRVHYICCIVQS